MSDWFARKLGVQPVPQTTSAPNGMTHPFQTTSVPRWAAPQTQQPVTPQPVQPQSVQQYGSGTVPAGMVPVGDLLQQQHYQTTKATSSLQDDLGPCPGCGGPNYVKAPRNPNSMPTCFDCGYNPRFEQSMAGMSAVGQQGIPQYTARVQQGNQTPSNYMSVVAKVGI